MTDRELLEQYVQVHSDESFAELVRRHTPMVYGTCYRILRNADLAEDATQATFLVLVRRAEALRSGNSPVAGWLYCAAIHSARYVHRTLARRSRHEKEAIEMRKHTQDEYRWKEDVCPNLDGVLQQLPQLQRDAIVLRYLNGLSESEAALELNCTCSAIHNRVRKGVASLREKLNRQGVVVSAATLGVFLSQQIAMQVPARLSETTTAVSLGKAVASSTATNAANLVVKSMTVTMMMSAKSIALIALITVFLGTSVAYFAMRPSKTSGSQSVSQAPSVDPLEAYKKPTLLKSIAGFQGGAHGVSYSTDGAIFAIGCGNGSIRVYDAMTYELQYELKGHQDKVRSICFANKVLVSSSDDCTVRLWDLNSHEVMKTLRGHGAAVNERGVTCVAASPDGLQIASAGWDGRIKVWDPATGRESLTVDWATNGCATVMYSPDGKFLAATSNEGYTQIIDARTGARVVQLQHSSEPLGAIAFLSDGSALASAGSGHVKLWSVPEGKLRRDMTVKSDHCMLRTTRDRALILACAEGESVVLFDALSTKLLCTLTGHPSGWSGFALSPDGRTLLTTSFGGTVNVWSVATPQS